MPTIDAARKMFGMSPEERAAAQFRLERLAARRYKREQDKFRKRRTVPHHGECLLCHAVGPVLWVDRMTAYPYTEEDRAAGVEDPNADIELCPGECTKAHIKQMDDQWEEYRRMQMGY